MKIIDIETWKRKVPYKNFINYTNPVFSLTTRLDVTNLVKRCKEKKESFFANFLFLVTKAINDTEELRLRIKDNKVVLFEEVDPSFIVMSENDVIVTCGIKNERDYKTFYRKIRDEINETKKGTQVEFNKTGENNCFYVTCLPWIDLTSLTNPYNLVDKEQTSIPRVSWGKFVEEWNGIYKMGFDISAHHALVDGYPLSVVINKISDYLSNLDEVL